MSGAVSGVPKTEGLKLKVQNPKSLASAKLPLGKGWDRGKSNDYTTSNCPQQQGSMVGFDKRMRPKPDNKERDG